MNEQDLSKLLEAQAAYQELFNEHESAMTAAAKDLQKKLQDAFYELYPEEKGQTYSKRYNHGYRWIFATDWIEINDEDGSLQAECWERGRCGDSDNILHTIPITLALLTEEGRQAMADKWKATEQSTADAEKKKAEASRIAKIKQLETELQKLKS